MKKRLLQTLITGLVMSSLVITPVMATPQGNIDELKENVENLENQKAEAEAQAESVNADLSQLLLEYNALELDMKNQEKKIEEATEDLEVAEAKEQQQYEDMKLRIKYMYEQGDASVIETLVQAKDFTDLVNKAEYVQEVHTYDREQLAEYVETKNEVKELKLSLEEGQAEMEGMAQEMEIQKSNLEETLTEMKGQIEDFDSQLKEAKAAAQAELQRLQEEAEREAREQAAREAAEREAREQAEREEAARQEAADQESTNQDSSSQDSSSSSNDSSDQSTSSGNTSSSNASVGQAIANKACEYIGNKYVYGGNSLTNGIDCSGFVQQIHAKFGISTPRTSSALRYGGKSVSYSEMLPGDVICYSGHVAIYIGNNTIVHASNSAPYPRGGIKTTSPANYRTVLAVRRYW